MRFWNKNITILKSPNFQHFNGCPTVQFWNNEVVMNRKCSKGHIFMAKNVSIQYLAAFQQYWHNIRTSA